MYDPLGIYSIDQLRDIAPEDLMELYKEALGASYVIEGRKQIQKVLEDTKVMRSLLTGYDGIYNRKYSR